MIYKIFYVLILTVAGNWVNALPIDNPDISKFISEMKQQHQYDEEYLNSIFKNANKLSSVLEAISRPAEKKLTWGEYRKIFLDEKRTNNGVAFWKKHRAELERAYQIYGVPPEMIIAILGIETRYGSYTGKYKVIDALSTLAFYYPKRSTFFRKQLKEYLILSRDQNIDPYSIRGSYAGAMGIPQFIPSSYRHYAIDFDDDNKIDIWNNPVDAIGSVANYFYKHKWLKNGEIIIRASVRGKSHEAAKKNELKPELTVFDLNKYNVIPEQTIDNRSKYSLLELQDGAEIQHWIGMHNFYVITRYNHSHLYAMAAYELAGEIKRKFLTTD